MPDLCGAKGLNPILQFEDRAQSGVTLIGRNGIARLMRAAQDGQYSVVIVEAVDRPSRDQEDLAHDLKVAGSNLAPGNQAGH